MAKTEQQGEGPNSRVQPATAPATQPPAGEQQDPLTGQDKKAGKPDPNAEQWSPPAVDEASGLTLHGDYPLSGPARAIALAKAGKKTDPDGIVSDDTIAAFKEA